MAARHFLPNKKQDEKTETKEMGFIVKIIMFLVCVGLSLDIPVHASDSKCRDLLSTLQEARVPLITKGSKWHLWRKAEKKDRALLKAIFDEQILSDPEVQARIKSPAGQDGITLQTKDGQEFYLTALDENTREALIHTKEGEPYRIKLKDEKESLLLKAGEEGLADNPYRESGGPYRQAVAPNPNEWKQRGTAKYRAVPGDMRWIFELAAKRSGAKKEVLDHIKPVTTEYVEFGPTKFNMGSADDEVPRYSDEKQHEVEITKPWEMPKTAVTRAEYYAVRGKLPEGVPEKDWDLPVTNVSYEDGLEYFKILNSIQDEYTYDYPTEAQWEAATRLGTETKYPHGDSEKELKKLTHFYGDGGPSGPMPVDSLEPDAAGRYHVVGNVRVWVKDWYKGDYGLSEKQLQNGVKDPTGPETGSSRVLRGGSWGSGVRGVRSADRNRDHPSRRRGDFGFASARTRRIP